MLSYYKMGEGPYYMFYRDCHLCHIEAMRTVKQVVLDKTPLLQPWKGQPTNVYSYAKQNLKEGDRLDGLGGYTCYGLLENNIGNERHAGLPILMADDVILRKPISKDQPIYMDDVYLPQQRLDFDTYLQR